MLTDLRHAFRQLLKAPGLTGLAVLMLALGTGANTAIFSVAHALLVAPLPYPGGERLVQIDVRGNQDSSRVAALTPLQFRQIQASGQPWWEAIAAWHYDYVSLTGIAQPVRLTGIQATDTYFDVLATPAWRGRTFNSKDSAPNASPTAVVSYDLWQNSLGAPPNLHDLTVAFDGVPHQVIGVMPPGFSDPFHNGSVWRPIPSTGGPNTDDSSRYWSGLARCRPGLNIDEIQFRLDQQNAAVVRDNPTVHQEWTASISSIRDQLLGSYREGVQLLAAAASVVLLVACANFSGLLLIRAAARRREFGVRLTLGAGRWSLVRAGLVESSLLATLGGILGVFIGWWGLDFLLATVPAGWLPRANEITLNFTVLTFAFVISALTGILAGAYPAWTTTKANLIETLHSGGRSSEAPHTVRLRSLLVIGQLGLALTLIITAGLIGHSFNAIRKTNPVLPAEHLIRLGFSLPDREFPDTESRRIYYARIIDEVAQVPGVHSAAFTQTMPFQWGIPAWFEVVGEATNESANPPAFYDSVSTNFLQTAGVPLIAGRWFEQQDQAQTPRVAVISAQTARAFFGDKSPLGHRLRFTTSIDSPGIEIIGVVGDVPRNGLSASVPLQVYAHLPQRPPQFATLLVRTQLTPEAMIKPVQQAIWAVNPDQAIADATPVTQLLERSLTEPRIYTMLFRTFAVLTLILSAVGLYSLIAFSISRRTKEFGIRMAIGAEPGRIHRQVLAEGYRLVAVGLGLGLGLSLIAAKLLSALLFLTPPWHFPTYLASAIVMLLTTWLAVLIPATRATRINLSLALHAD